MYLGRLAEKDRGTVTIDRRNLYMGFSVALLILGLCYREGWIRHVKKENGGARSARVEECEDYEMWQRCKVCHTWKRYEGRNS